jgi:carboxypeptidase Q
LLGIRSYIVLIFLSFSSSWASATVDSLLIRRLFDSALVAGQSWPMLEHLCKKVGHRLSGSPASYEAVKYTRNQMLRLGFDSVWVQEVKVPVWQRGAREEAYIRSERRVGSIQQENKNRVRVLALGGSVATDPSGLEAQLVEVPDVDSLKRMKREQIEGKIVFINKALDQRPINTFDAYSGCVGIRYGGVGEATKLGASAVIIRSITHLIDTFPHTGACSYGDAGRKIPAVAISTRDAEELSKQLRDNPKLTFYLKTNCRTLPDTISYNVVGELRGVEKPNEYLLIGGHLDSWDVGEGAHDDGVGVVQSIEVLRMFKALGIRPRHSLRVVLFMNEENGLRGGLAYADWARINSQKHLMALESDRGGFAPREFHMEMDSLALAKLQAFVPLLKPYGIHDIKPGFGGVDIGPLRDGNIWLLGYVPESQRYFDYHHAASDVLETVNRRELELGAAAMAALVYLVDRYAF